MTTLFINGENNNNGFDAFSFDLSCVDDVESLSDMESEDDDDDCRKPNVTHETDWTLLNQNNTNGFSSPLIDDARRKRIKSGESNSMNITSPHSVMDKIQNSLFATDALTNRHYLYNMNSNFFATTNNTMNLQQQQQQQHSLSLMLVNAVCFGWIKHRATEQWRNIIKLFSSNRASYPVWSDAIFYKVVELLRQRHRIESFYIFVSSKGKGKKGLGYWKCVTDQRHVILEKTRQRFVDDRRQPNHNSSKPFAAATTTTTAGAMMTKRRRGRPPKLWSTTMTDNYSTLHQHQPLLHQRQPCFQIAINTTTVCFDWDHHPGTMCWRDVVNEFACNTLVYGEWNDTILDSVMETLAQQGCTTYLEFLNDQGKPSASIHHGNWSHAAKSTILEKTKEQFHTQRQLFDAFASEMEALTQTIDFDIGE